MRTKQEYQEALDNLKRHIVGIPILSFFYVKDADLLQELIDNLKENE